MSNVMLPWDSTGSREEALYPSVKCRRRQEANTGLEPGGMNVERVRTSLPGGRRLEMRFAVTLVSSANRAFHQLKPDFIGPQNRRQGRVSLTDPSHTRRLAIVLACQRIRKGGEPP